MADVEKQFLQAIAKNPDDEEARSVYADWLEQHGDPRGEYLRLESQLHTIPPRLAALGASIAPEWLDAIARLYDVHLGDGGPNKIGTIKVIREVTGLGLKDSKDIVDASRDDRPYKVARKLPLGQAEQIRRKLAEAGARTSLVPYMEKPDLPYPAKLSIQSGEIVLVAIGQNQLIATIKLVREYTGLGLKEAKELVEGVRDGQPTVILRDVDADRAHEIRRSFAGTAEIEHRP